MPQPVSPAMISKGENGSFVTGSCHSAKHASMLDSALC